MTNKEKNIIAAKGRQTGSTIVTLLSLFEKKDRKKIIKILKGEGVIGL